MNKKGFTLIELLAVIALIAILTVLTTPAIVSVRNDTLEKSLISKINYVHTAAIEYASKYYLDIPSPVNDVTGSCIVSKKICNSKSYSESTPATCGTVNGVNCLSDCFLVTIDDLVSEGYLNSDDKNNLEYVNPLNSESILNRYVCVRFNNNTLSEKNEVNTIGERKLVAYIENECSLFFDGKCK